MGDYQFRLFKNEPIRENELEAGDNKTHDFANYNYATEVASDFSSYPDTAYVPVNDNQQQGHLYSQYPNHQEHNPPVLDIATIGRGTSNMIPSQQYQLPPRGRRFSLSDGTSNPVSETEKVTEEASIINPKTYPDITTLINSNSGIQAPLVRSTFVDYKICSICGKKINRDMLRHMRTHQSVARFRCNFPKNQCSHKSRRFNRPYDHKKHLLNRHFRFDNPEVKKLNNLNDKINHIGTCPCTRRYVAKEWLENHILTNIENQKCPLVE